MRILMVINDKAGATDAGLYDFIRKVGLAGHEIVLRMTDGDARLESLLSDASQFDRIVSAGGDGTTSTILYATRDTGIPVLVYPAGTANLLASNLGMPLDTSPLADILLEAPPQRFDLAELEWTDEEGNHEVMGFAVMAGAGYDARIMKGAEPLKPALGPAAYLVAAITTLNPTTANFRLVLDGEEVETDGIAVLVANFGKIQFDLPVTRGSDPNDGMLEVAVVRAKNPVELLPALAAAMLDKSGVHSDMNVGIDHYCAARVEVYAEPPLAIQSDGDVVNATTPFSARVLPSAATILVPPDSTYSG